ncbi:hypothetical protein [Streptomyces sp. AC550_RSS872]|uniref:hypothetical protein n=1 Tax=Streptomyces sp. AC550_RSS872 TaxID=2823689 RepID=UPI001C271CC5|nr:hypothetical protein [Streptomyces sp. AC550_RSS872]
MRTADMFIDGLGSYFPPTVTVASTVAQGPYSADEIEPHEHGGAVAGEMPAQEMALRAASSVPGSSTAAGTRRRRR